MNLRGFVAMVMTVLILYPVFYVSAGNDEIVLEYSFSPPVIHEYNGKFVFQIEKCELAVDAEKPVLPVKPLYILIPYGKGIANVVVRCNGKTFIGNYPLYIPNYPSTLYDSSINEKNGVDTYPQKDYEFVGVYAKRGYKIAVINLYPLQIGKDGAVYYYKNMRVKIELKDAEPNPLYRGFLRDEMEIIRMVENPDAALSYRLMKENKNEEYTFVIITSEELDKTFGQNTLRDFQAFKEKYGIHTKIVTVEEIEKNPDYWGDSPLFNDTQAKIRNFIKYAYLNWGTDFVLLAGDADVIPPRMLWAEGEFHIGYTIPSDVYYACLDGSYNGDGDMQWGEPNDGDGGGDVDLMAEVYVGRASVDNQEEISNFVKKTMWYEENYDDYVAKVLLAGEDLGWGGDAKWGGNHLDQLIDECDDGGYYTKGIPSDRFDITKLYDREAYWSKSDIISMLNSNFHIVCHYGHSNYYYNMRLTPDDITAIKNDKPFFAYSTGCMAGGFDQEDCMAEYFTVKTPYGAFAGIWNTRYGWGAGQDEPYDIIDYGSQRYAREFWDAIFGENIKELGKANQDSKEDNIWRINDLVMRFCFYEITLFGDPMAILKDVDFNAPEKPPTPQGEKEGKIKIEYEYQSFSTDPDGDKIYYCFDWGDGSEEWFGPYNSGEIVKASHAWNKRGSYEIRVKAKDIYGRESEWSDPLPVKMPLTSLWLKILETNPFISFWEWLFRIIIHA